MKNLFDSTKLFITMMLFGCALGFSSCSDDDDDANPGEEITAVCMNGNYVGKMSTSVIAELNNDESTTGTDIEAVVKNDSIMFNDFPVKGIIMSIIGDENAADAIIENIGTVTYKMGYEHTISQQKDFINLAFHAEPLCLKLITGINDEGVEQALNIEVEIEAVEGGQYQVENGNLQFAIIAKKVYLGEGENKMEFPVFVPTQFTFDLNQCRE